MTKKCMATTATRLAHGDGGAEPVVAVMLVMPVSMVPPYRGCNSRGLLTIDSTSASRLSRI